MGLASCHLSGAYTPGLDSKFLEKSYARDLTLIALAAVVKICQESSPLANGERRQSSAPRIRLTLLFLSEAESVPRKCRIYHNA